MGNWGKVFMLDDDRIFLDLYQNLFAGRGYDVFATDNAYQFLKYGHEIIPDVLVLDINMPRLNGWEVLGQINQDENLREIPVVMLSINQDENLADASGVAHFLYKPLAVEALADILESYCRGGRNHELLLIEDYEPLFNQIAAVLRQKHDCFCTHSVKAARRYLQKNQPKKILVRQNPEKFAETAIKLKPAPLKRVDNLADIENIVAESE